VNILFHLHSLRLSILPIFHKFSTSLKNSGGRNSPAPSLSLAQSPLLIHGVEEIPIALGGLHFVQ
jgi:hypothetical protein